MQALELVHKMVEELSRDDRRKLFITLYSEFWNDPETRSEIESSPDAGKTMEIFQFHMDPADEVLEDD